jgi:uncharacterized protein YdeI (YjbR/CyaY-like superfamily)
MIDDDYPVKTFKSASAFEAWLNKNYNKADGLWMKIAKANTGIKSITFPDALDIALCYGWIDGIRRALDKEYYVQKFTPRRNKSIWSVINKNKVAQLINEGRMKEGGFAAIEQAKKNGQWDRAYHSPANAQVPEDLQKALQKNKKARAFFEKLNSQNRFAILYRLQQVKRVETKKKKIDQYIKMLEDGKTIYPQ